MKNSDIIKNLMVIQGKKINLHRLSPNYDGGINEKDVEDIVKQHLKERMYEFQYKVYAEKKDALLIILQGLDTAGKDSTIRHVISAFNPLSCSVTSFKEPTIEELSHDFLWRIHKRVPSKGEIAIFNRSHYEDIIQPRVHKTIKKSNWSQRYRHINEFERCLPENRTKIIKFFLHISKEEQKKRLEERLKDPTKQWKISERDITERKFFSNYMVAYQDVINRSSNKWAPWYIIPANKKWFRNFVIGLIIVNTLEKMKPRFPKPLFDQSKLTIND